MKSSGRSTNPGAGATLDSFLRSAHIVAEERISGRPMRSIRTTIQSTVVAFLVGAYLSTWSAALVHSLVFPALGVGPPSVSDCQRPTKERLQIGFPGRHHMPLADANSISIAAPPPTDAEPSDERTWEQSIFCYLTVILPSSPLVSPHSGRAPPAC